MVHPRMGSIGLLLIYLCTIESHAMGYESISVTPVTPRIGAYVEGVTLAKPLSNRQVEELHQALAQHQVLFFRDQPLDVEAHKGFGRYFGELHIHRNIGRTLCGLPHPAADRERTEPGAAPAPDATPRPDGC